MKYAAAGGILLFAGVCLAAEYNGTELRRFALSGSGSDRRLLVSNITGTIRFTAVPGNEIRMTVREHWTAPSDQELVQGRSDVKLLMEQAGNSVTVTLDGPFRNPDRNHGWDRDGW